MSALSLVPALRFLDGVQNRSQSETVSPDSFARLVGDALASFGEVSGLPHLVSVLDELRALFPAVEAFIRRCLRIQLEFALDGLPVPPQFRKYLASEGTSYAGDIDTLHQRVAAATARIDPSLAGQAADGVVEVTQRMIALRAAMLEGFLGVVAQFASSQIEAAKRAARDTLLSDTDRRDWRVAVLDLKLLAENPVRLATKTFALRVVELAIPDEEAAPDPELVSRVKLLEID